MSDIARETLMAIAPDDFLEVHSGIRPPSRVNRKAGAQLYNESRLLYAFGLNLKARTRRAGWEPQFPLAVQSGSDRLFLSILKTLQPKEPTSAEIETRKWFRAVNLLPQIEIEVHGLTHFGYKTDMVTDEAEAELADYPAFVALSRDIEPVLLERGVDISIGENVRLGIVLGSLAIKRDLDKDEQRVEATIGADVAQDMSAWFNLE